MIEKYNRFRYRFGIFACAFRSDTDVDKFEAFQGDC
ncbi:hypothetical protein ACVWXP_003841 [Bradyrhizobium sp. USDA 4463]